MKNITYKNATLFFAATTLILLLLLNKSCNSEPSFADVKTPEIKGTFKTDTIFKENIIYVPKLYKDASNETKLKSDIVDLNNELQVYKDELDNAIDEFAYLDSIQKIDKYADAIALREFSQPFEDDFIKIENSGYTFGTLKSLKTSYTIKPQNHKIENPQVKYRLLAGVGGGINKELNQGIFNVNVGYQNKKGKINILIYSKINNQDFFIVNHILPIFTKVK